MTLSDIRGAMLAASVLGALFTYADRTSTDLAEESIDELHVTLADLESGDTFDFVMPDGATEKYRLRFADCPEYHADECGRPIEGRCQPFGLEARELAKNILDGQQVTLFEHGRTKAGRKIADVYVGHRSLCEELVRAGLAQLDPRYTKNPRLLQIEQDAIRAGCGLWSQPGIPTAPWDFRKRRGIP